MKTWTTIDKSDWGRGEWDNEPDKAQWIDAQSGFDCLIVRGPSGALCGYVGVPEGHLAFERNYGDVRGSDGECPDVHGGLTFSDRCSPETDPSRGICHTGDVANKTVWWLGFDCAHAWDITPKHRRSFSPDERYRSFSYVKDQVVELANQLAAN